MSKWFRMGLDVTQDMRDSPFGMKFALREEIRDWLTINCIDTWRTHDTLRKRRSAHTGYYEPICFIEVELKSGRDATLFRTFFGEKVTTSCRFKR